MSTELQPFAFHSHSLRIERDADGEPLFHVADLCAILEYKNPSEALRKHVDPDDLTKREGVDSRGRKNNPANWVREPGLWSLVLGSQAPGAKAAKRWLTAEVLPSLRRTGGYGVVPAQESARLQACQAEILKANPRLDEIHRLRKAGFSGVRILKLLGIGKTTLSRNIAKLKSMGLEESAL